MATQNAPDQKNEKPTNGFYVFSGLIVVALVIIVVYLIKSYL